jgi:hypothetical protein
MCSGSFDIILKRFNWPYLYTLFILFKLTIYLFLHRKFYINII